MLVLSRQKHESIMIGDDVEIMVVRICNKNQPVRLGIIAPSNVSIHRKEIWERIKREKEDNIHRAGDAAGATDGS